MIASANARVRRNNRRSGTLRPAAMRFLLLGFAALSSLAACGTLPGAAVFPQQSTLPAASPAVRCPPAPSACRDFDRDHLNDPRDPDFKLWIEQRAPLAATTGA